MKQITASIVALCDMQESEVREFLQWVWELRDLNCFDPEVVSYPRTVMCRAENEDGALAYLPLQPVLMFESLARRPGITTRQTAMSLWQIGLQADEMALQAGFRESYFLTTDAREAYVCSRHGWTIELHDPKRGYLMKHKIRALSTPLVEAGGKDV